MQSLRTLRDPRRQEPRNTRYQAGRYPLLGPDFCRLDRTSFAWRTYSISSSARDRSRDLPRLDAGLLDDRPPFLDFGLLKRAEFGGSFQYSDTAFSSRASQGSRRRGRRKLAPVPGTGSRTRVKGGSRKASNTSDTVDIVTERLIELLKKLETETAIAAVAGIVRRFGDANWLPAAERKRAA
jgi:hypothetical protein